MTISSILLTFSQNFSKAWAFVRNLFDRYKTLFRGVMYWTVIRTCVALASAVLSRLYIALGVARTAIQTYSRSASIGVAQYLSLANAVFPLQEAFALALALLLIKSAFLILNGIRYGYKNVPIVGG